MIRGDASLREARAASLAAPSKAVSFGRMIERLGNLARSVVRTISW